MSVLPEVYTISWSAKNSNWVRLKVWWPYPWLGEWGKRVF